MGSTLRLAWRNLWRNRRRTLLSMSAVGIGLTLVLVYSGLMSAMLADAKTQLDVTGMGHVELSAEGWRAHRGLGLSFDEPEQLLARLALPPGAEAGFRVVSRGLLSSAHGSQAVELHGVDWARERALASYVLDVREGTLPAPDDAQGVLVGEKLAERLQVKVGNKLRLMVQRADGEMAAQLFRVRGIYHSSSSGLSSRRVLLSLGPAQSLLGLQGRAHQLVIQLEEAALADEVAARLRATEGRKLDVRTYRDLFPMFRMMEQLMDSATLVAALFIYLLVGLGILNTMLMSVLERTREFGVLQALGTRPSGVLRVVLAESFWIATLSVAAGLLLGLLINWYGARNGLLDMSKAVGEAMDVGGVVLKSVFRTRLSAKDAVLASVYVYLMALLVGLYPAWRVSRMKPAEALRAK